MLFPSLDFVIKRVEGACRGRSVHVYMCCVLLGVQCIGVGHDVQFAALIKEDAAGHR
jgi:hypothetical protein